MTVMQADNVKIEVIAFKESLYPGQDKINTEILHRIVEKRYGKVVRDETQHTVNGKAQANSLVENSPSHPVVSNTHMTEKLHKDFNNSSWASNNSSNSHPVGYNTNHSSMTITGGSTILKTRMSIIVMLISFICVLFI